MPVPSEFYQDQRITVSSDIVGIFGNPQHALEFWQEVFPPGTPLALELLRWRHLSAEKIQELSPHIAGFHGRTGLDDFNRLKKDPIDTAKVVTVNTLLTKTDSITAEAKQISNGLSESDLAAQSLIYVLVHQMEADHLLKKKVTLAEGSLLAVENHVGAHAAEKALDTAARLRGSGHIVTDVFDVVHSIRSRFSKIAFFNWKKMLAELHQVKQTLVHLPIGVNMADSLDYGKIDSKMWWDLSDVIKENSSRVVIEHQIGGLPLLKLRPANREYLLERAKAVVGTLKEHEII